MVRRDMSCADRESQERGETKGDAHKTIEQAELQSRILFLSGSIDKESANDMTKSLLLLDELSQEPIKIFINSPGGEVHSGFFIFDCIRFLSSPVHMIGAGLVASAASLIYLAVEKKRRLSLPHARYMLHQPLSEMRGVVTDLEIYSHEIDNLKSLLNIIVSRETGKDLAVVERDMDRDFWLDARKAEEYGLVGKIIEHKKELGELFEKTEKKKEKREKSLSASLSQAKPAKKR